MIVEKKRCYGCMELKSDDRFCEYCGYDEQSTNAPHQLPAGTILREQYLIGRVLGQGGFGITYLGWDLHLDTPVAIKEYYPTGMVSRDASSSHEVTVVVDSMDTRFAENRARFLREARILARLESVPEVVQVKNYFPENNTAYIIMGYVKGITLKEYIRRKGGKLTARETFHLMRPLMEALEQVHTAGLVHRDISPDNIMLQSNGKLRLIDFGAAHEATAGDKSTQAVLKYGFAPPEQYQRKGQLGPWTDVYALCATIYCCLTGQLPPNVTDRMLGEEDFDWDSIPDLTPVQRETLERGVAVQHTDRIQSMKSLCWGLFGADRTEIRHGTKKKKSSPSQKLLPLLLAAAAVLLAVALVVTQGKTPPEPPEDTNPVIQQDPTDEPEAEPTEQETLPTEPETTPTQPEATAPAVVGSRVLWNPPVIEKEGSYDWETNYAFGTDVLRTDVRSITVLDSVRNAPADAVDASRDGDGSVLAWAVPNEGMYDLYLAAKGGVIAPKNCEQLFAYFGGMERMDLSALDTSEVTDMTKMFYLCQNLTELDISGFDTGNVKDMQYMFGACMCLRSLDISGFDTGRVNNMQGMFYECMELRELNRSAFDTRNVRDMSWMFYLCFDLKELDLSDFDTGNVTDMSNMFTGCEGMEKLNVSGFDTGKVENMRDMFYGCYVIEELDVSGFKTGNVTDMSQMFYGTEGLRNIKGNFDFSKVESFEDFMDEGDTFNGKPWEELFR